MYKKSNVFCEQTVFFSFSSLRVRFYENLFLTLESTMVIDTARVILSKEYWICQVQNSAKRTFLMSLDPAGIISTYIFVCMKP